MGREAKVKAATRHARATMRERAKRGASLTDPAAMEAAVPPATAREIGRYRTIKRIVSRALALPPKSAAAPVSIMVTRNDARHPKRVARDAARRK